MNVSLKWFKDIFKSEKEKKLEELKIEREIKYLEEPVPVLTSNYVVKPYSKIKLVKNVLTIVLQDGSVLSKPNATIVDFKTARETKTEEELLKIASSSEGIQERRQKETEVNKMRAVIKGIEILRQSPDFQVIDNSVYFKGVKRSMPKLLVEKFAEIVGRGLLFQNEEYQALKKFWLKCCLNPNARSAEDLYEFLQNHQFKIDKHGNFYAYRRVVSKNTKNQALVEFVSNAYSKVKAVWKKKPSNFAVWNRLGDYKLLECNKTTPSEDNPYWELVDNLESLYLNLPNMQEKTYTDAHTGTMDYRVGQASSIPRNEGNDDNNVSCSRGLHIASKAYNYEGFGDTAVLAIINPMDVLAVPKNEVGKLRTSRWFFAMTLPEDEKYILDDEDFDVSDLGDVFEEQCLVNLEEHVKNGFVEEVKRHTFTLSNITSSEITGIVATLEDMKNAISGRIVAVED